MSPLKQSLITKYFELIKDEILNAGYETYEITEELDNLEKAIKNLKDEG